MAIKRATLSNSCSPGPWQHHILAVQSVFPFPLFFCIQWTIRSSLRLSSLDKQKGAAEIFPERQCTIVFRQLM